ncbi:MAG TPA: demethoxyubiquinone hydroxylase family protein [Phenylobacterium sp.]|nr:demethoxyubiquinone hydroxylase family protein [Phenylobacterium sp.]
MRRRDAIARILRVNHGGEHGAIAIYRAQLAAARWRCPELTPFLAETLSHELEHRRRFRALMPARNARPCRAMWTWGLGGAALGAFTGLLGRQAVLICTEAVERTVHQHLDDQLAFLGGRDPELSRTIREIGEQEQGHLTHAVAERRPKQALGRALDAVVSAATEVLIWLSTQGDSARLARELAAARRAP